MAVSSKDILYREQAIGMRHTGSLAFRYKANATSMMEASTLTWSQSPPSSGWQTTNRTVIK
jgi:hypothetical protein